MSLETTPESFPVGFVERGDAPVARAASPLWKWAFIGLLSLVGAGALGVVLLAELRESEAPAAEERPRPRLRFDGGDFQVPSFPLPAPPMAEPVPASAPQPEPPAVAAPVIPELPPPEPRFGPYPYELPPPVPAAPSRPDQARRDPGGAGREAAAVGAPLRVRRRIRGQHRERRDRGGHRPPRPGRPRPVRDQDEHRLRPPA